MRILFDLFSEKALNLIFRQCLHGTREEMDKACMILCHTLLFVDSELDSRPVAYRKALVQTLGQIVIASAEPDFSADVLFKKRIRKMSLYGANQIFTFTFLAEIEGITVEEKIT